MLSGFGASARAQPSIQNNNKLKNSESQLWKKDKFVICSRLQYGEAKSNAT